MSDSLIVQVLILGSVLLIGIFVLIMGKLDKSNKPPIKHSS